MLRMMNCTWRSHVLLIFRLSINYRIIGYCVSRIKLRFHRLDRILHVAKSIRNLKICHVIDASVIFLSNNSIELDRGRNGNRLHTHWIIYSEQRPLAIFIWNSKLSKWYDLLALMSLNSYPRFRFVFDSLELLQ